MKAEQRDDIAVLGIDAAWTAHHPSGVALVAKSGRTWRCVRVAGSYADFVGAANPSATEIEAARIEETRIEENGAAVLRRLLASARNLVDGKQIVAAAIDMPLSRTRMVTRRAADNQISSIFNRAKCPTHSLNVERPGARSVTLRDVFKKAGFSLATKAVKMNLPAVFEVYPHAALLGLLGETERIKYKVGKSRSYWPLASLQERKARLIAQLQRIHAGLAREIGDIPLQLPRNAAQVESFAALKTLEDQLDALVCSWVAIQFVNNNAVAFGDGKAAIWIPKPSLRIMGRCDLI